MDALTTCNACEAAPMAPGQDAPGKPGYCYECLPGPVPKHVARKTINGHAITVELYPVSLGGPTYVVRCGCGGGPWEAYYPSAAEVAVTQHTREAAS